MADVKISDLIPLVATAADDILMIVDTSAETSRKVALSDLLTPISVTVAGLTDSALTASRAVVSGAAGVLAASAATATELGYLSGVTSSIQTQLNNAGPGLPGEPGAPGLPGASGDGLVHPEDYGAVGDGTTDDWQAFQDMFDDLVGSQEVKLKLNPTSYYCIKSRYNATTVFLIAGVENIQMEGPGMNIKTLAYEGADPATNFFYYDSTAGYFRLSEMRVELALGSADRSEYKITNCVYLNNCNFGSLYRFSGYYGSGYGLTGFHWMTECYHVVFYKFDTGFGTPATTAHMIGCYANECRVGYEIAGWYAFYSACSADWADIAYSFGEPWSVAMSGCGCEKAHQAMSGRALGLVVDGFTVDQSEDGGSLTFTSGSRCPLQGETITGATSGETALVYRVHVTSGTWGAGTAAGTIRINVAPSGAFQAENLNIGAETNVCTIGGDVALPEACFYLPQSRGRISGLYGKVETTYWFDGTENSPHLIIDYPGGYAGTSFKAAIKDYAGADYANVPVIIGNEHTGYNQEPQAISLLRNYIEVDFSRYHAAQEFVIGCSAAAVEWASTVNWKLMDGPGSIRIEGQGSEHTSIIELHPASGVGMILSDLQSRVVFKDIKFQLSAQVHMIQIARCREVWFVNCLFENLAGGGRVFDIDAYSTVILDKDTMDNMVTAGWWAIEASGRQDAIKFTGYTANPSAGLFNGGHRVAFNAPGTGTYSGAVCTAGGVPGTWKGVGLVE